MGDRPRRPQRPGQLAPGALTTPTAPRRSAGALTRPTASQALRSQRGQALARSCSATMSTRGDAGSRRMSAIPGRRARRPAGSGSGLTPMARPARKRWASEEYEAPRCNAKQMGAARSVAAQPHLRQYASRARSTWR